MRKIWSAVPGNRMSPEYDVEVCLHCDPVAPENVGPQVEAVCPECARPLFGLRGTEIVDNGSD